MTEQQRGGELSGRIEKIRSKLLNDESVRIHISRRAYELYLSRGGEHGHHFEDWVQAENEILTPLIERELKRSSEVRIARSQESGGGATTGPSAETPAPRKIPTRDEDGGGRMTSTKPSGPNAPAGPSAETSALKKVPTHDEGGGSRMNSTKPSGPNAAAGPSAETPALKKVPTRDEGGGSRMNSTKPSGAKRPRRKGPGEGSPN